MARRVLVRGYLPVDSPEWALDLESESGLSASGYESIASGSWRVQVADLEDMETVLVDEGADDDV